MAQPDQPRSLIATVWFVYTQKEHTEATTIRESAQVQAIRANTNSSPAVPGQDLSSDSENIAGNF